MTHSFHFGDIWAAREQLFRGTLLTLASRRLEVRLARAYQPSYRH